MRKLIALIAVVLSGCAVYPVDYPRVYAPVVVSPVQVVPHGVVVIGRGRHHGWGHRGHRR